MEEEEGGGSRFTWLGKCIAGGGERCSKLITGCCVRLHVKPASLLKVLGCS